MYNRLKFNNKTQIGIFIIIAVIVVILGIVFFTIKSDFKIWDDQKSSYKVKEFVESCIESETKIAENKLGLHGGWLYSPLYTGDNILFIGKDTNKYLIKHGRGFKDLGKVKIPYWFYYDDSDESFNTYIPEFDSNSEYSIKNQLKRHIKENILTCINKFDAFKDVYNIKYNTEDLDIKVDFIEEKIDINMIFPLQILEINSNNTEFISEFNIELENKLKTPYYLARDIVSAEISSSFLEKRILSFITPYQTTENRDLLPPYYEFKLKYDFKPWDVRHVEKIFKQIVSSNINLIQFYNTNYKTVKPPKELKNNDFANSVYQIYTKDYLSENSEIKEENPSLFKKYKDYDVSTTYESFFPTFFSLSPSMGDIILLPKPEAVINLLPFFFTEYVAVYEITNPIVFEIKSHRSYNDKFLFNLAIETNIDHNTPLIENVEHLLKPEKLNLKPKKTLICDPTQFISDWVYLNISDPIIHGKRYYDQNKKKMNMFETGINDAIVTFNCKDLATCYIGTTSINGKYKSENITTLKFRLPIGCNPGKLEISKWGYDKLIFKNLNPEIETPIKLGKVYMSSEKTFNLSVGLINPKGSKYATLEAIKDNETGFLIFKHLTNSDYVQVVEVNKKNQYNLTINLLPGNYSIEGFLLTEKPFTIPEEKVCYKKGMFGKKDCETIPAIQMDAWMKGSYSLQRYEIPIKYLANYNRITVPIINFGIPHTFEELKSSSNVMKDLKLISKGKTPYFDRE